MKRGEVAEVQFLSEFSREGEKVGARFMGAYFK